MRLFTEQGFDETPIEQIAAEARRAGTFFRYFSSKSSVLWGEFDAEVEAIRAALAAVPATVPMIDAIRRAVVAANHYRAEDVPELRARMNLIISVRPSRPARPCGTTRGSGDQRFRRHPDRPVGRLPLPARRRPGTLAVCRAAYDRWCARADADLTVYLDAAVAALAAASRLTSAPKNKR